jgi:hypothetical protein
MTFTAAELACMQAAAESVMMDVCELLTRFETDRVDDYGMPVVEWISLQGVACGLDMRSSGEVRNAEANLWDARLRLPIDMDVNRVDRVVITHRFGVLLAEPLLYQVDGEPLRGPSCLVIKLRSV